jgi:RNA polymerase sigma-70 factor (ECF subfamily)
MRDDGLPTGDPLTGSSISLLRRAKAGDHSALEEFCRRYVRVLRRWATGRLPRGVRGLVDTDDLVQQVLFETVRGLDDFDPIGEKPLHAYLRQALLSRILDEARRAQRKPHTADSFPEPADPGPSPLEVTIGRQNLRAYEAALARLRSADQDAIVARIEMGIPYDELATMLGSPTPNAARMTVIRALTRLAEEIAREP